MIILQLSSDASYPNYMDVVRVWVICKSELVHIELASHDKYYPVIYNLDTKHSQIPKRYMIL